MKIKLLFILVVFIALLINSPTIYAEIIELRAAPTQVRGGEKIILVMNVRNSYSFQELAVYYSLQCPAGFTSFPQEYAFNLTPQAFKQIVRTIDVPTNIYSGECFVVVQLVALNDSSILDSRNINVTIIGLAPPPHLTLMTCGDASCKSEKSVFILGETVYFQYIPDIEESSATAFVNKPDGKQEKIEWGKQNFTLYTPKEIGSYQIRLDIETVEYGTLRLKHDFAIIAQQPIIKESHCGNKVCEPAETKFSCLTDCGKGILKIVILIVSITVIVLVIIYKLFKKRSNY